MYVHLIHAWDKKSPEEKDLVHCEYWKSSLGRLCVKAAVSLAPDAN